MRVFVPFPDDFDGMPDLSRVRLVPYRPGMALGIEPDPPRAEAHREEGVASALPATARAA